MNLIKVLKRNLLGKRTSSFQVNDLPERFYLQGGFQKLQSISQISFQDNKSLDQVQYILNDLGLAIWSIDLIEDRVIFVSDQLSEIYETPKQLIAIDDWKEMLHKDNMHDIPTMYTRLSTEGTNTHVYRIVTPKGTVKWLRETIVAIKDPNETIIGVIGAVEDITHSKHLEQKISHISLQDQLTNLPNFIYGRKYLDNLIEKNRLSQENFAIFCINLDRFSKINYSLGYSVADEVIKGISTRLSGFLKKGYFLYRFQGDEWIAVIQNSGKQDEYFRLAKDLIGIIQEPLYISEYVLHIDASIGISVFPEDGDNKMDLLKKARNALKRAKNMGPSNFQIYSKALDIESFKYYKLVADLHAAIENKELYLEYQPKIEVQTQKVTCAEALLRWNHPDWGEVSPGEFIAIAEEHSFHHEITDFVIDSICRQVSDWERQGIPFQKVSFNLTAKDFLSSTLIERIEHAISKYNVKPKYLEIELTEGALLLDGGIVQEHVKKLQKLGISLSLDDFGTGFSSIYYLKQLPVNTVKIDKSFIDQLAVNKEDEIIVKSIIDLSKGLKKQVVAEGVETEEQYQALCRLGCDIIQGYYYSRPISVNEITKWFTNPNVLPQGKTKYRMNRRKYYRVNFPYALSTEMTILSFNGRKVTLGSTEVMLVDIGLGGLRFISHLRLKPHENILYGFQTLLLGTKIKLKGKIVRYEERAQGIFEYGVQFTITEAERVHLSTILNQVSIIMRSNPLFKDGNFIEDKPTTYLKQRYL